MHAGPASQSTLQIAWASAKATLGSSRLSYGQFLKVLGALSAELSGDVLLLAAGLGLQLPQLPALRNGFRVRNWATGAAGRVAAAGRVGDTGGTKGVTT